MLLLLSACKVGESSNFTKSSIAQILNQYDVSVGRKELDKEFPLGKKTQKEKKKEKAGGAPI